MSTVDEIYRVLRDRERYTGDGKPNAPVGAPLPTGDPRSGTHNVRLAELRALLIAMLQAQGDDEALQEILVQVAAKVDSTDFTAALRDSGKIYATRAAAVNAGQSVLTSAIGRIFTVEGSDLVLRSQSASADDPLFEASPRWGVVMRIFGQQAVSQLVSDEAEIRLSSTQNSGLVNLGTADGTGDALTLTMPETGWADGLTPNSLQNVRFMASAANATNAPTVSINGDPALQIRGPNGGTLSVGHIVAGRVYDLVRASNGWRLVSDVNKADLDQGLAGKQPVGDYATAAQVQQISATSGISPGIHATNTTAANLVYTYEVPFSTDTMIMGLSGKAVAAGKVSVYVLDVGTGNVRTVRAASAAYNVAVGEFTITLATPLLAPAGSIVGIHQHDGAALTRSTATPARGYVSSMPSALPVGQVLAVNTPALATANIGFVLRLSSGQIVGAYAYTAAVEKQTAEAKSDVGRLTQTTDLPRVIQDAAVYPFPTTGTVVNNRQTVCLSEWQAPYDMRLREFRAMHSEGGAIQYVFAVDATRNADGTWRYKEGQVFSYTAVAGENVIGADQLGEFVLKKGQYLAVSLDKVRYSGGDAKEYIRLPMPSSDRFMFGVTGTANETYPYRLFTRAEFEPLTKYHAEYTYSAGTDEILGMSLYDVGDASITTTATTATTRVRLAGYFGNKVIASATHTVALPSVKRFDLISYNTLTDVLVYTAGGDATFSYHGMRAKAPAGHIPLYLLRVAATGITHATPLWKLDAEGMSRTLRPFIDEHKRRNRRAISRFIGKAAAGKPLRILAIGDSITSNDTLPYYSDYGADAAYIATFQTFTAAQMGYEGTGTNYVKAPIPWHLNNALEARGYTLTQDLVYVNRAVGGSKSSDFVSNDGTFTSFGSSVLALPKFDLVYCAYGMNEQAEAEAEQRLTHIANAFKAMGTDVILNDSSRRRGGQDAASLINRRATERAARLTGSALLSWSWVDDQRWPEMYEGVTQLEVCEANAQNHPGREEMACMGRLLVATTIGA